MRAKILLLLLFPGGLLAQNLVSNPGLDNFITCPGFGQFSNTYIVDWSKPTIASSDYYNFNCPAILPDNEFPYDGEGYAGIIAYNYGTEYREYITGVLTAPLTAGQVYEVEFYVSLHNNYIQAIQEMGAYLSPAFPGPQSNVLHLAVTPQIVNTGGALTDTSGWTKVFGTFTATGGEQFITIGNFNDDAGTTISQPYFIGSYGAYYFVDGVSVKAVSTSGIQDPVSNNVTVSIVDGSLFIKHLPENTNSFEVYDASGKTIFVSGAIYDQNITVPFSGQAAGVYLLVYSDTKGILGQKKFVVQQ